MRMPTRARAQRCRRRRELYTTVRLERIGDTYSERTSKDKVCTSEQLTLEHGSS